MEWLFLQAKKIPIGFLIFCFFAFVYSLTIRAQLSYGDEAARYLEAKSIVTGGTFAIPTIPDTNKIGIDGKNYNRFEFGYELLLIPSYALARTILGVAADRDGAPMLFMGVLNSFITALTCLVVFWFSCALQVQRRTALWITVIFGLGTIAWPYSQGLFRESLQSLTLLLSVYAVVRHQQSGDIKWLAIAAISLGCLIFTKTADIIFLPVILVYVLTGRQRELTSNSAIAGWIDNAKILVLFLIPTGMFLLLQSWVSIVKFGTLFTFGPTYENSLLPYFSISNLWVGVGGLLFSTEKSLFIYSPPVLLFLFSWIEIFRKNRREAILILFLVALTILLYGAYYDWTSGSFWGPRYLVEIVPFMVLPIGVALDSASGARRWYWIGLSAVCFLMGLFVQTIATTTNAREYADVVGKRIDLLGGLDFLRHGGIDSVALFVSPQDGFLHVNTYGWLSLGLATLVGVALLTSVNNRSDVDKHESLWYGFAVLAIAIGIHAIGLVQWVAIPYNNVLSKKADTQYVAGNDFFSDSRFCEARMMYSEALAFGTVFPFEAMSRLEEISPRAQGIQVEIGDFASHLPEPEKAEVKEQLGPSDRASLDIVTLQDKEVNAEATTDFFELLPNTQYEFSGWLKVDGVYGSGNALIGLYEDDANWRKTRFSELVSGRGPRGLQLSRQIITTLPTTRRALVKLGFSQAYGKISVGGIHLTQLDPTGGSQKTPLCQQTRGK